jgi:hypothetical protein
MNKARHCMNTKGCTNAPTKEFNPFCSERCRRIYYGTHQDYCAYSGCSNKIPDNRIHLKSLEKYYCSFDCYKKDVLDKMLS